MSSRRLFRVLLSVIVLFQAVFFFHFQTIINRQFSWPSHESRIETTPSNQQRQQLPQWLDDYFHWHNAMRLQYPGTSLITHPDSPGVLIKACAHKCGGLHDRLGGLGWDLYLANQTRRVLLIHWCIPAPIEHYLVPNAVDWTLPRNTNNSSITSTDEEEYVWDERLFSNLTQTHTHCDNAVHNWPGLFDGYSEYRPGAEFWNTHVDLALDRATHGEYSNHKILRVKILGFDEFLEKRLREKHGEMDAIGWTDTFPTMFWTMFRPSVGLQKEVDAAFIDLELLPNSMGPWSPFDDFPTKMLPTTMRKKTNTLPPTLLPNYFAIHARVRHPRGHEGYTIKGLGKGNPDREGLQWDDGLTREFAIGNAEHAFQCARERKRNSGGKNFKTTTSKPIYIFFADSEELVSYMGKTHRQDGLRVRNASMVRKVVHIDRQQEMAPESYYDSFIDLFIASQASCIAFGAGNYALLAAKMNTRGARKCLVRHYVDTSHSVILRNKFMDCNDRYNFTLCPIWIATPITNSYKRLKLITRLLIMVT